MNQIQINEQQLFQILQEAVKIAINEIGYSTASLPTISNLKANFELKRGNDIKVGANGKVTSMQKQRGRASEMSYKVITQGVKDNVGENFLLTFGRTEEDRTVSNVIFHFNEVLLLTPKRLVIQGNCITSRSPIPVSKSKPKRIQIDYHFDNSTFYEAVYCANGTVRDMKILELDYAGIDGQKNVDTAKRLIQFATMCLYSIDDGITLIGNKQPFTNTNTIPSK